MKKKWIIIGIICIIAIFMLFEKLHGCYNIHLAQVTIIKISNTKVVFKLPVKTAAGTLKQKQPSSRYYHYNAVCKEDPVSSCFICFIPEEEKVFLVFSKMSLLDTYVHDFSITDSGRQREFIQYLKQIKPDKIIK